MVRHASQADLEARLSAAGEQPSFKTRSPGHLQHRCVNFPNTFVNFWPSKSSWNVQGQQQAALEICLEEPVPTSNVLADTNCRRPLPHHRGPACTASGVPHPLLPAKAVSVQCGDTYGESAKVPTCVEDRSYIPRSGDEPLLAKVSKELVVGKGPGAVETRSEHGATRAAAPEEPLCSEFVKLVKATVIEDVAKQIKDHFSWWRGEQRRTMQEMYTRFCSERKQSCQSALSSLSSDQNPFLSESLQTMMSVWLGREGCALEQIYLQWEDVEHEALGSIFASWTQRFDGIITQVLTSMKADLRSEAQRELEAWKMQERKHLLADMDRVSAVDADEQQSLRHELLSMKQQHRAEAAKLEASERVLEDLLRRAESAETEVKRAAAVPAARTQKQPVYTKRYEHLSKRIRWEASSHPILGKFDVDLFRKITAQQESGMHRARMAGNAAAHRAIGTFGPQVPRNEAHPDTEAHACSGSDCDVAGCEFDWYDCGFDGNDGYH